MRVAALYDIHANLPALEKVLSDLRGHEVDRIVVGGDLIPGPMPEETLDLLLGLHLPVDFILGNGELAILAQLEAREMGEARYWGTTSGAKPPEPVIDTYQWTARQLRPEHVQAITGWPRSLKLKIEGLGWVLFVHGTPRSEVEIFTAKTPEKKLLPLFKPLGVDVVVCGHTHMPFDRMVGKTRVVNAGSVGSPYGDPSSHWLLLGPDIRKKQSDYDREEVGWQIRSTGYPQADGFANDVVNPPSTDEMTDVFEEWALRTTPA